MRKIGIVTLNGGTNFGNKLQNYALQRVIAELGYQAVTLQNHVTEGIGVHRAESPTRRFDLSRYTRAVRSRLHYKYHLKNSKGGGLLWDCAFACLHRKKIKKTLSERDRVFRAFEAESIKLDPVPITDLAASNLNSEEYSAFVAGSDQIWNPYYSFTSAVSFLQFAQGKKRVAYAPSFGVSEVPQALTAQYAEWLLSIPSLSAREEQGVELIRRLTGRTAALVADPTMLLTEARWEEVAKKPGNFPSKDYILTYFLGDVTSEYWKEIRLIAKRHHCEIVNLLDIKQPQYYAAGPTEFVYYIRNAKYVCTDSFHGTVFAIMMHRPFAIFQRLDEDGNMQSRFATLLHNVGIEERHSENGIFHYDDIHYNDVDKKLESLRQSSIDFLSNALQLAAGNE